MLRFFLFLQKMDTVYVLIPFVAVVCAYGKQAYQIYINVKRNLRVKHMRCKNYVNFDAN